MKGMALNMTKDAVSNGSGEDGRKAAFRPLALMASAAALLALPGCISLGAEPPDALITLTSTARAAVGTGNTLARGGTEAIGVLSLETPAKLDVTRVPVMVSDTSIAYLQDAVWVEKPARLFRGLLGETLRTRGNVLVLENDDTVQLASEYLRGSLIDMGYDADEGAVIVRFDAMRTDPAGTIVTRRFEARETGIAPEAAAVGPALNRVANVVAGEVADWMLFTPQG